jgi:lipopolysaccharide/colanic/teichoic acid biosynthesis glycosyltransferase
MIDVHTHLLPGVDDGARTIEQSLEVLHRFATSGVRCVVCTPHLVASEASVSGTTARGSGGVASDVWVREAADPENESLLREAFTYEEPLSIGRVQPDRGAIAGGTLVTVLGSGFGEGTVVQFGQFTAKDIKFVTPHLITCRTPRGDVGTVDVKVVPDLFNYVTLRGGLEEFGGLPIISLQGAPLDGWNLIAKRVFDLMVSAAALLVLLPVMLLVGILVKLTSRGPVFFAQERMGMDGHLFHMYKFRTMRTDAEKDGAQFATADDPRRTVIGSFLRKTSIDELPQFWNVFVGDMSLVGPRPERPVFIQEFKKQIPRYHLRHMVKAGITGWAQVNGLRGNTSIKDRIDYDLYYIENWSLLFDLKILLRTAFGGFLSKNAY